MQLLAGSLLELLQAATTLYAGRPPSFTAYGVDFANQEWDLDLTRYPGMSGARSGYEFRQPESDASTGRIIAERGMAGAVRVDNGSEADRSMNGMKVEQALKRAKLADLTVIRYYLLARQSDNTVALKVE
jgi:hypothetical protein